MVVSLEKVQLVVLRVTCPHFTQPAEAWKAHNCIPDEHYVQTLLAVSQ